MEGLPEGGEGGAETKVAAKAGTGYGSESPTERNPVTWENHYT